MKKRTGTVDFMATLQEFLAFESVGVSAVRKQGKGVLGATRAYLAAMPLDRVPLKSKARFGTYLDKQTAGLLECLPIRNRPWGTARKALNLFLRSCVCSHYVRSHFGLGAVEGWLEIPLDSVTANALKRVAGHGQLPRWPGLKHLDKETGEAFQAFASEHAVELGLPARVFLDNYLWLRNR